MWGKKRVDRVKKTVQPARKGKRKASQAVVRKSKPMNIKKLAYEVSKLSCEKKEYGSYSSGLTVGQIYVSGAGANPSSGHYLTSFITPNPSNGTSDITRIGDDITITGIHNLLQFSHMSNTGQGIRGKVYLFAPKLGITNSTLSISQFLNPNPIIYAANSNLVSVYDTMSTRNMDFVNNFRVLRVKNFYMPSDQASLSQKLVKTVDCSLKFKKPWKVHFDSTGALSYGQIYMLVVLESGNSTSNVPSALTAGIPITDTVSGLNLNWYAKTYFIDP